MCLQLGSADEQCCWLRLLFGHCRCELDLPRSVSWLLQAPTPLSIVVRFPVVEPCKCPCNPHGTDHNRGSFKATHSSAGDEGGAGYPLGFCWRNQRLRRDFPTQCCAGWGCRSVVKLSLFSYPSNAIGLGLCGAGASASPPRSGLSPYVLFLSSCSLFL